MRPPLQWQWPCRVAASHPKPPKTPLWQCLQKMFDSWELKKILRKTIGIAMSFEKYFGRKVLRNLVGFVLICVTFWFAHKTWVAGNWGRNVNVNVNVDVDFAVDVDVGVDATSTSTSTSMPS